MTTLVRNRQVQRLGTLSIFAWKIRPRKERCILGLINMSREVSKCEGWVQFDFVSGMMPVIANEVEIANEG